MTLDPDESALDRAFRWIAAAMRSDRVRILAREYDLVFDSHPDVVEDLIGPSGLGELP